MTLVKPCLPAGPMGAEPMPLNPPRNPLRLADEGWKVGRALVAKTRPARFEGRWRLDLDAAAGALARSERARSDE